MLVEGPFVRRVDAVERKPMGPVSQPIRDSLFTVLSDLGTPLDVQQIAD
jgi:hypothetical protein